jgi:hypothetical protein
LVVPVTEFFAGSVVDSRLSVPISQQKTKQLPDPPKNPCYGGESNSQATGAIVGLAMAGVIEAPELGGALLALGRGARLGAVLSELAGPQAVPVGLIVGGVVGIGVYLYDKHTEGSVSQPVNSALGQCSKK